MRSNWASIAFAMVSKDLPIEWHSSSVTGTPCWKTMRVGSPEALHSLTSEQRHHLYKMLRLRLITNEDGTAALDANALPRVDCSKLENLW